MIPEPTSTDGVPQEVVTKLNDALVKSLEDENTKKRLADLGGVLPTAEERTPAGLQKLVDSEVARWTPVLKAAGATGQ